MGSNSLCIAFFMGKNCVTLGTGGTERVAEVWRGTSGAYDKLEGGKGATQLMIIADEKEPLQKTRAILVKFPEQPRSIKKHPMR